MRGPSVVIVFIIAFLFSPQVTAEQSSEHLVFTPYPEGTKWKEITNKGDTNGWMRELIPSEQDITNIKDIITVQAFSGPKLPDPSDFLKRMMKSSVSACENVRVNGPKGAEERGHDVAYGQVYCGKQNDKDYGVNMFIKVLKGKDALYVVQREFHVPVTAVGGVMSFSAGQMDQMKAMMKATNETMKYLVDVVTLCATSDTDTRCSEPSSKK